MATNYLPPFANASGANVIDYATWITLTDQQTGFEQGIARSIRCNFPWAEGAAAAHALGEIVVANTTQDATINASALATNLKASLVQTAVTQTITGAKTFSGAVTVTAPTSSDSLIPGSGSGKVFLADSGNTVKIVPEPATAVLALAGIAMLIRRRKA